MSWQDELRALDEQLAAGELSADEYRTNRDRLLSVAASAGSPVEQDPSSAEKTQYIPPISESPRHDASADRTQVVPGRQDSGQESTQAISRGNPPAAPWQSAQPGDSDSTQVVPNVPPRAHPGLRPTPELGGQGAPWSQHHDQPPWGGSDFPPLISANNPDWVKQGPEVFDPSSRGTSTKIALIIGAVIVALGLGAGAVWYFAASDENPSPPQATNSATEQAPTTTVRPKDDLEVAPLPGDGGENTSITSMNDVLNTEILTQEEKRTYTDAGGEGARLVAATLPQGAEGLVLTVRTDSAKAATTARDALLKLQKKYTMKNYPGTTPAGVLVTQFAKSESFPAVIRAHYTHQKTIVRVQVSGPDLDKIGPLFDSVLAEQLETLSADA